MFEIKIVGTEALASKIKSMSETARKETSNTVKKATLKAEAVAKEELKPGRGKRTGHLQRSISHLFIGDMEGVVGTNVSYAPFLEFGTKPHTIVPKTKSIMAFVKEGKTVFTKFVKHPGIKKIEYFKKGADKAFKLIEDKLGDAVKLIEGA